MRRPNSSACILSAFVLLSPVAALGGVTVTPIILSNQPAPGLSNSIKFGSYVNRPAIRGSQLAFVGNLVGSGVSGSNNSGIWAGQPGGLKLCVREGATAPGCKSGETFSGFGDPLLSANGDVAFIGFLRGSGIKANNDSGLWMTVKGKPQLVAREGATVPGMKIQFGPISSPVFNQKGEIAFFSTLQGSGVTNKNDTCIWAGMPGSLGIVARESEGAPGTPKGQVFSALYRPVINDSGQVAFRAVLTGTGVTTQNSIGIWMEGKKGLELIVRQGTEAPDAGSGVTYNVLGDPSINNAGQLAFTSSLAGKVNSSNNRALFVGAPGKIRMVARTGDGAPGTKNLKFRELYDPCINADGQVAFQALLTGSGVTTANDMGVWAGTRGKLRLIAREGDAAPGTEKGVTFASFVSMPQINAQGQVSVLARLTGKGVNSATDMGIWATTRKGELVLIARKGSKLQVGKLDARTVTALSLIPTAAGSEDGRSNCMTGSGEVVFHATFADGSQGIFLAKVS